MAIYVLSDNYAGMDSINKEQIYAMQTLGVTFVFIALYRFFFYATDIMLERQNFSRILMITQYYINYQLLSISLSSLVGIPKQAPSLRNIIMQWVLINIVLTFIPLAIFQEIREYLVYGVIGLYLFIDMPKTIRKWMNCRSHIINTIPKAKQQYKKLQRILITMLVLILWPLCGIVLLCSSMYNMPIHCLITTVFYLILMVQYKDYFTSLILESDD